MDVIAKVLLTAGTLGISCGGTPWLLRQINSLNSQNKVRPLPARPALTPAVKSIPVSTPSLVETPPKAPEEKSVQAPVIPAQEEVSSPDPQPPAKVKRNEENCSVENRVDDLETLLSNSFVLSERDLVDTSIFVKVNCTNTILDSNSRIPTNWEGLFPKTLFERKEEVVEGRRIEVKTQTTEDSTSKYKTTFSGSHFLKEVAGEWSKTGLNIDEKSITEVRITSSGRSSEKIYLMFKK